MKEKLPEKKSLESSEKIHMEELYSGIGKDIMGKVPEIGRVFLREGGYTEEQIKQIEIATPKAEQSPEDSRKTIDLYRRFIEEFRRKGEEGIAKAFREAVDKLEEELNNKSKE